MQEIGDGRCLSPRQQRPTISASANSQQQKKKTRFGNIEFFLKKLKFLLKRLLEP
jgi:hypothetical protein